MSGWLTPKLECNKKLQVIPSESPSSRGYMARLERALPRCDTTRCALWSAWI